MERAPDWGLGEIETSLNEMAIRLLRERMPTHALHALTASVPGPSTGAWDRGLWAEMVELGWAAVAVPERAGGPGVSTAGTLRLLEAIGHFAVPSPLPSTVATTFVLAACETTEADAMAQAIADGTAATLATDGAFGGPELTARGGRLSGIATFVQDAAKAELLLVHAHDGLYAVRPSDPGVEMQPDRIVDLTRDQARISFTDTPATRVGQAGAWKRALPALLAALAADMVGAAEWQLQTTVEYARTRVQFDRPLGFFQAVKHPLVDVMIAVDQARTLLYDTAAAIDAGEPDALMLARMAKAAAGDAATLASSRSVQLHGGIGFTWECFVHLYFKRQQHTQVLLGDAAHHRAHLADALLGRA